MWNRVILTGRLTKDPKKGGSEENPVTVFTLAVQRSFTNKQGERDADFIQIKAFKGKKLAQTCSKYLKKGMLIGVEAKLHQGSYVKDGKTAYTLDVIAEDVKFLEPIKRDNNQSSNYDNNRENNNPFTPNDDPFTGSSDYEPGNDWPFGS